MNYVLPLIGEAWDHSRRRRRRGYVTMAALLALVALAVVSVPGSPRPGANVGVGLRIPSGTIQLSPTAAFTQAPYMGVHCPVANSIACDEVGLAVWLRRPAYSVDASIAGASLPLNWFGEEYPLGDVARSRRAFDGYLHRAGIVSRLHVRALSGAMWFGDGAPSAMVWVLINYRDGHHALTHLRVPLMAGWG
jgi:hypothetical protein